MITKIRMISVGPNLPIRFLLKDETQNYAKKQVEIPFSLI
jgi:hypothetical protein